MINLRNNDLFYGKTAEEIDAFLISLGDARSRLDLSHNCEGEFARFIAPLASMVNEGTRLNLDVAAHIASYLTPNSEEKTKEFVNLHIEDPERYVLEEEEEATHANCHDILAFFMMTEINLAMTVVLSLGLAILALPGLGFTAIPFTTTYAIGASMTALGSCFHALRFFFSPPIPTEENHGPFNREEQTMQNQPSFKLSLQ